MQSVMVAAVLTLTTLSGAYASTAAEFEGRAETILKQMSIEEKIDLLGGTNVFYVRGVPRLGVPMLATADGHFGVRRNSRANIMAGRLPGRVAGVPASTPAHRSASLFPYVSNERVNA